MSSRAKVSVNQKWRQTKVSPLAEVTSYKKVPSCYNDRHAKESPCKSVPYCKSVPSCKSDPACKRFAVQKCPIVQNWPSVQKSRRAKVSTRAKVTLRAKVTPCESDAFPFNLHSLLIKNFSKYWKLFILFFIFEKYNTKKSCFIVFF